MRALILEQPTGELGIDRAALAWGRHQLRAIGLLGAGSVALLLLAYVVVGVTVYLTISLALGSAILWFQLTRHLSTFSSRFGEGI